jgi:hypothetical protein
VGVEMVGDAAHQQIGAEGAAEAGGGHLGDLP